MGGQAAHSGGDGALSSAGACPCCSLVPSFPQERINITLDHRCRIFQNLDGALGEQPPRGGVERGVVTRRGDSRQGLSPRGRNGWFFSVHCAGGHLMHTLSPGPQRPPGCPGVELYVSSGGERRVTRSVFRTRPIPGQGAASRPGGSWAMHTAGPISTLGPRSFQVSRPCPPTSQPKISWAGGRH